MEIAITGTGIVGRSIAARLDELGHSVTIGTRNIENTLSGESGYAKWQADHKNVALKTFSDAASGAEIIFNCTSGMVSLSALEQVGELNLKGKVLIDVANPLDFSNGMPPTLNPVNTDSLGEQIQRRFPQTRVVKTLNTMTAALMVEPGLVDGDHTVFVCGNDADAKQTVKDLLGQIGWRATQILDLGDITTARGTEMMLPVWLRLWSALGTAEFNFQIQRNG